MPAQQKFYVQVTQTKTGFIEIQAQNEAEAKTIAEYPEENKDIDYLDIETQVIENILTSPNFEQMKDFLTQREAPLTT